MQTLHAFASDYHCDHTYKGNDAKQCGYGNHRIIDIGRSADCGTGGLDKSYERIIFIIRVADLYHCLPGGLELRGAEIKESLQHTLFYRF